MWLLKTILIVGGVIWFTNLLHAQPAASAPPEPTYSITLTTKQIMAIGALLDAAQCLISSVVQGTCDTLSTYQAKWLSAAGTNSTLVNTGRTMLRSLLLVNTTTTVYYLKLFNKATAPTCGTDVPLWTIPVPYGATNSGSGVALPTGGLQFPAGLGFCLTSGIADNDAGSAATGLVINLGVSGY